MEAAVIVLEEVKKEAIQDPACEQREEREIVGGGRNCGRKSKWEG